MAKDEDYFDDDDDTLPKKKEKKSEEIKSKDKEEVLEKKAVKRVNKESRLDAIRKMMAGIAEADKWWKPQAGDNQIRILPDVNGDGRFFHRMNLHYGFVDREKNKRAYPCLSEFKKPCPVCRVILYYQDDDDSDVGSVLKSLRPNLKYLMNVIDRKDESQIIKLYSASPAIIKDLKRFIMDDEVGDITDPDTGRDVIITKEGEGYQTRYKARTRIKETPIGLANWKENMYDLANEAYREVPTYEKYVNYIKENFNDVLLDIDKATKLKKRDIEVEEEGENDII